MGNTMNDDEIDLLELLYAMKRKLWIILAVTLLGGALSCAYTKFLMTPVYTSTSSILVLTKETTLTSLADLQLGSQLTSDYEVLITSRNVLQDVIDHLGLDLDYKLLREKVTIENPTSTRILNISVEYEDPVMAMNIVNELTTVASAFIGDQMEVVPPKIIEEGELPLEKTGPSTTKNTLIGLIVGFFLSAGTICVMTILDDTIKTEDDVTKYLGMATLANIPDRKDYITGKTSKDSHKKAKKKKGGK